MLSLNLTGPSLRSEPKMAGSSTITGSAEILHGTSMEPDRTSSTISGIEEALKRSEAYLAAGQRLSHTGSWALNVLSKELFWSEETFRIFGVDPATPSSSLCETFVQRIHPEDRPGIEQGIKEAPKAAAGITRRIIGLFCRTKRSGISTMWSTRLRTRLARL